MSWVLFFVVVVVVVFVVVVVVPDEFENFSFYLYEELRWDFDGDCFECVYCFWQDGHFYYINPADPRAWKIFPSSEVFFDFF